MPISADPKPSDAIAARNRANARHSTGPRSAAGKAAGSRNAVTHGLLSIHPLTVGAEDQAAMDAHRIAYCAALGAAHREAQGSHPTNGTHHPRTAPCAPYAGEWLQMLGGTEP